MAAQPEDASHLVAPLLRFARERGASLEDAPRGLGALFDAVASALDEPHLGLLLPGALVFSRYELPDLAARSSATLRESLVRLTRYAALLGEGVSFGFEEREGLGRFSQRVIGHPRGLSRHLNEFAMAMGVHECRARTGQPMKVREVCFVNPRPGGSLEALSQYFGTTALHFGHLENVLVFEAQVLDAEQTTADARLLETATVLAEEALSRRGHGGGLRESVERTVRLQLEGGALSIRTLAMGLHMSTRTLQRRLEAEGTSYAQVLDAVRQSLARRLVSSAEPSLSEIAFQLGFAEFATFSRAFKRWTGVSPGAFRQGELG
jgi:AraC-like DNA-binding protein